MLCKKLLCMLKTCLYAEETCYVCGKNSLCILKNTCYEYKKPGMFTGKNYVAKKKEENVMCAEKKTPK